MIVSTAIVTVSMACYAFSTNIAMLFAARIVHGIAFSFMGVSNMALGSDFVPSSRMGEGLGYLGLGNILAYAIGPSMGLEINQTYGFPAVFGLAATLAFISVVAMFAIPNKPTSPRLKVELEPAQKPEEKKKFALENFFAKDITLYVVILILFTSGNGLMNTYLAIMGDERGIPNVGLYFTAYSLVVLLVRPVAGKINDRFGLSAIMIPSFFLGATGMLCVAGAKVWCPSSSPEVSRPWARERPSRPSRPTVSSIWEKSGLEWQPAPVISARTWATPSPPLWEALWYRISVTVPCMQDTPSCCLQADWAAIFCKGTWKRKSWRFFWKIMENIPPFRL